MGDGRTDLHRVIPVVAGLLLGASLGSLSAWADDSGWICSKVRAVTLGAPTVKVDGQRVDARFWDAYRRIQPEVRWHGEAWLMPAAGAGAEPVSLTEQF